MLRFERFQAFYKGIAYKRLTNAQICSFWHRIFTSMAMKNRSSQPNGVENGLNMSQSVPNIKINHRKHILELYKWHKDHLQKSGSNPPPKKKFPVNTKIRHNGTQNGTPVVPKMSNGTLIVPKMVPKWYPNSLTHFIRRSIFMIFQVQKMATSPLRVPFGVPSQIFGYHRLFFCKTYHFSIWEKNVRNTSRYLLT